MLLNLLDLLFAALNEVFKRTMKNRPGRSIAEILERK